MKFTYKQNDGLPTNIKDNKNKKNEYLIYK